MSETIEQLLQAFGEAQFDCGNWRRDDSDDTYDTVHKQALEARAALVKAIEQETGR